MCVCINNNVFICVTAKIKHFHPPPLKSTLIMPGILLHTFRNRPTVLRPPCITNDGLSQAGSQAAALVEMLSQ